MSNSNVRKGLLPYCITRRYLTLMTYGRIGNIKHCKLLGIDVVEDSEVQTSRRSEGLFYAARSFASKAVSALGIILAGSIVSLVGMDGIKTVEDMTDVMRGNLASFFLPA